MSFADCGFEDQGRVSGAARLVAVGPTIPVCIGFDPSFIPLDERPPDLPDQLVPALIDTGAVSTCIDSSLAASFGLPVVERAGLAGVHGPGLVDVYVAQMFVPDLAVSFSGRFHAAGLSAGDQYHRAIIGRDFLQHYTMTYDGRTGAVRLVGDPP